MVWFLQVPILLIVFPCNLCSGERSLEQLEQPGPPFIESMIQRLVFNEENGNPEIDLQPFNNYRSFLKNQMFKKSQAFSEDTN